LKALKADSYLLVNNNIPTPGNITEEKEAGLAKVRHVGKKRAQEILVTMEAKGFWSIHIINQHTPFFLMYT